MHEKEPLTTVCTNIPSFSGPARSNYSGLNTQDMACLLVFFQVDSILECHHFID